MRFVLFVLLMGIGWMGCSAPKTIEEPEPTGISISEVETFNPENYPLEIPAPRVEITHDVPRALLEGKADLMMAPEEFRQVDGYRIQIFSTTDKDEAEKVRNEAIQWWEIRRNDPLAPVELLGEELPIYILYQPPFYRVRIGDLTSRADAEIVLDYFREKFRDAWIVPDKVYVR